MSGIIYSPSGTGAGPEDLPSNNNLMGLLLNAADSGKSRKALQDALALVNYVRSGNPDVCVILDSGGYELYKALERSAKCIFDRNRPIYLRDIFNITPAHIIKVAMHLRPDIIITLDRPVPKTGDRAEGQFLWMQAHGYNVLNAIETVGLCHKHLAPLKPKVLVPIQTYDPTQFDVFVDDVGAIIKKIDGFSLPFRNLNPTRLSLFLLKIYRLDMNKLVHILGIGSFGMLAVAAFAARNWFEMVTCDSTSWRKFANVECYLRPCDLRSIRLSEDMRIPESILSAPLECGCSWCAYYRNLSEVRILPYRDKTTFLAAHNFAAIDQFCKDVFAHADSPRELNRYLLARTKGARAGVIEEVYSCTSKLDLIKDGISHQGINSLWRLMCE